MKTLHLGVVSVAALLTSLALADEKSLKPLLEERLPGIKIDSIQKAPWPGMYEVFSNGRIFYSDEKAQYAFQGSLIDLKSKINISAERLQKLTAIPFSQLPFDLAVKVVKGNGQRQLAIFEDPDCPFCRQLEKEMMKVDNVTVYVFLYPLEQLHPGATEKSKKIWCSTDKAKAWLAAVQDGVMPDGKADCTNPVAQLAEFGRTHNITGTPTLFFANGDRVPGAISADMLEKQLGSSLPK